MNPVLDEIVVAALVLAAIAYFLIPAWLGKTKGCGCGCQCPAKKPLGKAR